MSTLHSELPFELCTTITDNVDCQEDLKNLRSVCITFHNAVSAKLFETVKFSSLAGNAAKCRGIWESPRLAQHVKELVFDDSKIDSYLDENEDHLHPSRTNDDFKDTAGCFQALGQKFPRLRKLAIHFRPIVLHDNRNVHMCRRVRCLGTLPAPRIPPPSQPDSSIFENLFAHPPPHFLESLTLSGIASRATPVYQSQGYKSFVSSIKSLSIAVQPCLYGDYTNTGWAARVFWRETMIHIIKPASSIVALSIISIDGIVTLTDEDDWTRVLTLPNLTSLSLCGFTFSESGVMSFIHRHRSTIKRLGLYRSTVLVQEYEMEVPKLTWSSILHTLELDFQLVELDTSLTDGWMWGYTFVHNNNVSHRLPDPAKDGRAALRSLRNSIKERKSRGTPYVPPLLAFTIPGVYGYD